MKKLSLARTLQQLGRLARVATAVAVAAVTALPALATLTGAFPSQTALVVATGGSYSFAVAGSVGETVSTQSRFCFDVGVPVPANGILSVASATCTTSSVIPINPVVATGSVYSFSGSLTAAQASTLASEAAAAGQPAGSRYVYWRQGFGTSGFAVVRVNLIEAVVTPVTPPSLLPALLSFGNVQIGQASVPQTLTFASNTAATHPALEIAHPPWTTVTTTCPTSLTANLTCQITAVCAPSSAGLLSSTISVVAGTLSTQSTVSCTGVFGPVITPGTAPSLLPASINFGPVTLGSVVTQVFNLSNPGSGALNGIAINTAPGFTYTSTCGNTLAANSSCQITVFFAPLAAQAYSGLLSVSAGTTLLSSGLSGIGTATPVVGAASSLTDVSPKRLVGNVSAELSQVISYSFNGNSSSVAPGDGIFCLDLIAGLPAGNTSNGNPCSSSSQFARHPTNPASFQSTRVGSAIRTVRETIRVPSAVSRFARENGRSRYYFARQFAPNQYALVAIELLGDVANQPIAVTSMRMYFKQGGEQPIVFLKRGDSLPVVEARITYTGSGWLRGAWEVVQPGDVEPSDRDLVSDASLPLELRGLQRRYTVVGTFQQYLPAVGQLILTPPDLARFPLRVDGGYRVVLRLFADAAIGGADNDGRFASGGAAFPLPTARYFVGSFASHGTAATLAPLALSLPPAGHRFASAEPVTFRWLATHDAAIYLLEASDAAGNQVAAAQVPASTVTTNSTYAAPAPWRSQAAGLAARWRVTAFAANGEPLAQSDWRPVRF